MAKTKDYALVVGINEYDWNILESLRGPKNDANNFVEWLRSPKGGNVPDKNILPYFLIGANNKEPQSTDILDRVMKISRFSKDDDKPIGRRLYIFLAGHGTASEPKDAALLTSDANRNFPLHIIGRLYAELFGATAWFQEVVLIMDCCRFSGLVSGKGSVYNFGGKFDEAEGGKTEYFYAYATGFGRAAREKKFGKEVNGIFSRILMEGLRGGAIDGEGKITVGSLRRFIEKKIEAKRIDQEPELDGKDKFVIVDGLPPAEAKIVIRATLNPDQTLEVCRNDFTPIGISPQKMGRTKYEIWLPIGEVYIFQLRNAQGTVFGQGLSKVEDSEKVYNVTL